MFDAKAAPDALRVVAIRTVPLDCNSAHANRCRVARVHPHCRQIADGIKRGLVEAIEHAEGRAMQTRVHRPRPVDVKALRAKVGMTQEQFAARFGFSTATLRHWDRGDRAPQGPALVLLNVIEHNPNAVIAALAAPGLLAA